MTSLFLDPCIIFAHDNATANDKKGYRDPLTGNYTFTATSDFAITAIFLPIPEVASEVEVYVPKKIDINPIFMIKNGGTQAFLTDKIGKFLGEAPKFEKPVTTPQEGGEQ